MNLIELENAIESFGTGLAQRTSDGAAVGVHFSGLYISGSLTFSPIKNGELLFRFSYNSIVREHYHDEYWKLAKDRLDNFQQTLLDLKEEFGWKAQEMEEEYLTMKKETK